MREYNIQETLTRDTSMPQVRQKVSATQVVPFEAMHIAAIDPQGEAVSLAEFYKKAGPAYTALENGKPIAAAGLIICGKIAHAWGVVSDRARARPFFLHRTTVNLLALELARYRVETVIVLTDDSFPAAAKWMARMGFEATSKMTAHVLRRSNELA